MKQTEARRLAGLLNSFTVSRPQASTLKDTATLLLRQDELLKQALEALETCWSVGLTEANWKQVEDAMKVIRAHREAK